MMVPMTTILIALVLVGYWALWSRMRDARRELEIQRGVNETLTDDKADLVAALVETRTQLRRIERTSSSEDDKILAGSTADRIGELLIEHRTARGG